MEELVLKRCYGREYYLSFLCLQHMSPKENICALPFYDASDSRIGVRCNSCRGLMYFDDFEGNILLCSLTTKEFKLLSPPNDGPYTIFLCGGLGYDSKSGDYKVITNYLHDEEDEGVRKLKTVVYSLSSDSWKEIPGPGGGIDSVGDYCGVYLEGRCYWLVRVGDGLDYADYVVLSFDFASETFSRLPLPQAPGNVDLFHELFECDGFLGVIGLDRFAKDYESRVGKYFELWVRREGSWAKLFGVVLFDVGNFGTPLGLRDGRYMFYEKWSSNYTQNHLMVYDWVKGELKEYDHIYNRVHGMNLLSYVENRVVMRDPKPLKLISSEDLSEKALERCGCH